MGVDVDHLLELNLELLLIFLVIVEATVDVPSQFIDDLWWEVL